MEVDVFPALVRLVGALEQANTFMKQVCVIFRIAEEEAARPFKSDSISDSEAVQSNNSSSETIVEPLTTQDPLDLEKEFTDFKAPEGDKDGMIEVPEKWIADLFGLQRRSITMTEKKLMDEQGLFGQIDLYNIQKEAFEMAEKFAGSNGQEDGLGDAYRHAYWNALMVRRFGDDWAKNYSDAHENIAGNPKTKAFMDLWNNNLGIRIALENPNISKQELANKIAEAVRNGEAIIIDGVSQKPIYSDQGQGVKDLPNPEAAST
ncbi:MAG: hypothetical protein WAZ19_07875, partial [Anaerolineae bacterium]